MQRRIGDRRSKPRFEIVGDLWGTVEVGATLRIKNLSRGGALLECPMPLIPESTHTVRAVADGQSLPLTMRIRHSVAPTREQPSYLVGVEFLNLPVALDEFIMRYVALADDSAVGA